MDIDERLLELQDFADRYKNLWCFAGRSQEHWGFILTLNQDCRVLVTVTPVGFCVRTNDRIHTTAGRDIERIMKDVERYFLDRYGLQR